jgi:hypothetical protein
MLQDYLDVKQRLSNSVAEDRGAVQKVLGSSPALVIIFVELFGAFSYIEGLHKRSIWL